LIVVLREVYIAGLTMDPDSNTPIIILVCEETQQTVPIWIGLLEATSIASALKEVQFERPMTHDLFKLFVEHQRCSVSKIEVSDIKDNTYYARIYFDAEKGPFSMDSRPSDAIAIALRFKAPIFVEDKVLESAGTATTVSEGEAVDTSEEGRKWAEYLENLSLDDFGKV
jgi:bifunctional DNase/RNase